MLDLIVEYLKLAMLFGFIGTVVTLSYLGSRPTPPV
jgi:hypothetical protein